MSSAIDIANLALAQLGSAPITAFSGETVEAQLCAQYYPVIRDSVLEDHNWTFAIKRVVLNPLAKKPAFQFDFAFPLPPGTLRVLLVSQYKGTNFTHPQNAIYQVEGNTIVSNHAVIYVQLIQRIESTDLFSASFTDALACRLAAEMCTAITNSRKLTDQLFNLYGMKIGMAARSDGMQGTSQRMPPGSLVTAR